MKKLLFAVLIVSALIGCKEEKTNDPLGLWDQIPRKEGGAKFGDGDKFGPSENKSSDPFPKGKQNHNCLWCGVQLGSERNPIITLSLDTLASPRLLNENQLCGFKCYNEFKNSYFKTNTDQITQKASGAVYRIKISNK
jgi:hypothetical protein